MSGLAPGRKHDMEMLQARLRSAKSVQEKQMIQGKINYLLREGNDPEIAKLRGHLVQAARNGDNKAGEEIGEHIYSLQNRLKR